MNQHPNRRPDEFDDRSRNQHNRHDERRPHDRFGDNYEPRRHDYWREEPRDEQGRFRSRWDQPHEADDRRRHQEDDDRRRGFSHYGDYAGSDRGRGYGAGRPEAGRADYTRRPDDDSRRPSRDADSRGYHPEGTSGYLSDRRTDDRDTSRHARDNSGRRGYDDARNLPSRRDFDQRPSHSSESYRDNFASRPEPRDEESRQDYRRTPDRRTPDRPEQRRRYDGSNRDGARSDYGYGDDYSSSLYDPNSRNSAFRRPEDNRNAPRDQAERRGRDSRRGWSDTPDLGNQRRR
ncbi:hypothetical protein [Hymenobacter jeollabukensis]|uniref:Uncharacterized protein n=1 Tax=Hymenobacter jeollabukensis TaxID=2025313 RepID=A0A5R8WXC6_9BACT|nr:hypothetical protein [Hymenobacter jeollabukensis]TLM96882.1 hypothetical protein FDY95_02500 [Hymenobacter jeollabukensis]